MSKKFKIYKQRETADCGPACLQMICNYFGKEYRIEYLREISYNTRNGTNFSNIIEAAKTVGLKTMAVEASLEQMVEAAPLPCLLHWRHNHYVILFDIRNRNGGGSDGKKNRRPKKYLIADPAHGAFELDEAIFIKDWQTNGVGFALFFEPTQNFPVAEPKNDSPTQNKLAFIIRYLFPFKKHLFFVGITIGVTALLNLALPFLAQQLVDKGVNNKDFYIVNLVLLSQLAIFFGVTIIEMIKSKIFLYINTRIKLTIASDYLVKLLSLPMKFFDAKLATDLIKRMGDIGRVENFLTSSSINIIFALFTFFSFGIALLYYSPVVLLVFLIGSGLAVGWIFLFLKRRERLDYTRFDMLTDVSNVEYELINGCHEIKLNNAEDFMRWHWEKKQVSVFGTNLKSLHLDQFQMLGNTFFTQLKNIFISYLAAREVINGSLTLGGMLSISYMIGQMNGPVMQFIGFVTSAQDAKISLNRLEEIHNRKDEDAMASSNEGKATGFDIKAYSAIEFKQVFFQYGGKDSPVVLKNLNFTIPRGKVTAIVGSSGSGKTTMLKLLLRFYAPQHGQIEVGGINLNEFNAKEWRSYCGCVMQEGFIFSKTITENIALSDETPDIDKVKWATHIAAIDNFIEGLPAKYETIIGTSGLTMSTGQQQRIFIARAIYKNADILLFDEATSSLDANTEKAIVHNLNQVYKDKTVVVIAHRLSTVKNADQIVVLENGEIVEIGTHERLAQKKGYYFTLVKNQLELGE